MLLATSSQGLTLIIGNSLQVQDDSKKQPILGMQIPSQGAGVVPAAFHWEQKTCSTNFASPGAWNSANGLPILWGVEGSQRGCPSFFGLPHFEADPGRKGEREREKQKIRRRKKAKQTKLHKRREAKPCTKIYHPTVVAPTATGLSASVFMCVS